MWGRVARRWAPSPRVGSRARRAMARCACAQPAARAEAAGARHMQMNLFERFGRVVRATGNKIVGSMENPEKILEQTMIDMNNDLVKVRQAYAEVSATAKRIERQREQAVQTATEWKSRAQLALQKGDEELAREALVRKTQQDETAASLTSQLENMSASVAKLQESMSEIESKIAEAQGMKDELIARARTAQTTNKVNDMLGNVGTSSGLAAFERMREKVETLEAQSEISSQMALGQGNSKATPSLESRFKQLESGSAVDAELAKMKAQLPSAKNPRVDDELERLRKEAGL
ncbi:Membrane-associated 30 kDa protein, chloroplastic [Porphyridium purpureum]|uniref:Membrane-associated 30 kDa protein, chloroplastic n=1 Tax=Porphyridium purpureum TaxID=35688 RepID=A0A5J4YYW1_PORPP|nr:Membrane-associated 30 kDa protein, chloroplastic [Porphyridium purpureum]|eukprot:POR1113..scf208_2